MPNQQPKRQTRGAVQKDGATFIAAWVPDDVVLAMDQQVQREDTDRSKLMRMALKQYLSKTA
jgi:metal-responsive CopG/Arc/MetJ family transcriptional regulator